MDRTRLASTGLALGLAVSLAAPAAADDTITLMTHDSFFLPEGTFEAFEAEHDVSVRLLPAGDAGAMVNQAILTADDPLADVLFGVDNTFLSRALEAGIFAPHISPALASVPEALQLDPEHRVTPIDVGHVCLNLDRAAFEDGDLPRPQALEDLTDPALAGQLVVQNPATSSPGLAFLLATVAAFGEDGWGEYWSALRDNGVTVTSGWEEAYYGYFSGAAGGEGELPIVVSYASSPVAEVIYGSDPEAEVSPTVALEAGCFEQVEFAAVLAGSEQPELAGALVDFLLSPEVQAELPEAMFVYPARSDVALPEAFERHALVPAEPASLDPAVIDANREDWIREWTDIVLR
ncbi:MAG: thiamine ABC transporter substrate-binding protein [Candidatus Limnocylindrales bacterium]